MGWAPVLGQQGVWGPRSPPMKSVSPPGQAVVCGAVSPGKARGQEPQWETWVRTCSSDVSAPGRVPWVSQGLQN